MQSEQVLHIPLTRQQHQIIRLAGEGLTTKEIAAQLGVTHSRVRHDRDRILDKLEARSLTNAVKIACKKGWI